MVRRFEFNAIYVIESLKDDDIKTGTALYDDLLKRQSYKVDYLRMEIKRTNSKDALFLEFEEIKKLVLQNDLSPFFHFEIHGSPEGLVLNSNELVTWMELTNRLREINLLLKNNLFVSFATCYSAHIYQEVQPFLPSPFFAFIGSWEQVTQEDVMYSFYHFFESIFDNEDLSNIDLAKAIKKLNDSKKQPTYYFYNAEQIFDKAMSEHDKSLADPIQLNKRIAGIIEKFQKDENLKKIPTTKLEKLIRDVYKENEKIKLGFKKIFLMQ
jgi:hypothetical protein